MAGLQRFHLGFYAFWSVYIQVCLWGATLLLKWLGVGKWLPLFLNAPQLAGKGDTMLLVLPLTLTFIHAVVIIIHISVEVVRGR